MLRYQTWSPWSCSRMWPFCSLPNRSIPLNLLFSIAALQLGRIELVLEDPRVVQVVIHARASGDDAALVDADPAGVPLAGWFLDTRGHLPGRTRWTCRRRQHVVERRRLAVGADFRVGVPLVVDQLVFVADGRIPVLENEVLQAAVAARRDLPLPGQVEQIVGLGGDDVARAARVLAVPGGKRQESVGDRPARAGGIRSSCRGASRSATCRRTARRPRRRRAAAAPAAPARRVRSRRGRRRLRARQIGVRKRITSPFRRWQPHQLAAGTERPVDSGRRKLSGVEPSATARNRTL